MLALGTLVRIILPMSLRRFQVAFFAFTQGVERVPLRHRLRQQRGGATITTGLSLFIIEDVFFWGPMMGASFLGDLPPVASTWSSSAGS